MTPGLKRDAVTNLQRPAPKYRVTPVSITARNEQISGRSKWPRPSHTLKAALNLAADGWRAGYRVRIVSPADAPEIIPLNNTLIAP